jgi:aryl-alcohol dehydrogenase-like predicted oxidoreductase/predicted kinase
MVGPWIGVQRLSLAPPPEREQVLERAIARGVRWLDVADVYGPAPGDAELGLARIEGIRIATKGGLVRAGGRWVPDGRASHLERAAIASRRRLGVDAIDLYQLHAPDPRVAFATSLRALARLRADGVVRAVGLCNVGATALAAALELVPVDALQIELSPYRPGAFRSGAVELARDQGVPVLAYRPLGGPEGIRRLRRHEGLAALAAERGVTPEQLVLTWLRDLGVQPLAGPTRRETLDLTLDALDAPPLDERARDALDGWFEPGRLRRTRAQRSARAGTRAGEVVIVMGSPGSGKTTRVRELERYEGYLRLNRDDRGGTLEGVVGALRDALAAGVDRVVLDNTYPSRALRSPVIEAAWDAGLPVRCEWLTTSPNAAEVNVVNRILDALGSLPEPDAFDRLNRRDPGIIPPRALSRYRSMFEPPRADEGFARIDELPFERRAGGGGAGALLLDPRDLVGSWADAIRAQADAGLVPVVIGWEPTADRDAVIDRWRQRARAIGITAEIALCPHPAGPPVCWCRKPLPGLALATLRRLGCATSRSVALGRLPADRAVAAKLGIPCLSRGEPTRS